MRRISTPRTLLAVLALLAYLLTGWFGQAPENAEESGSPPVLAAGGFGRPVQLGSIDASGDSQVALASGGDNVYVAWEQPDGVRLAPLFDDARSAPPVDTLVASNGIRGLWAGSAGGDPVVAWLERDMQDGSYRLLWTWRGETREAFRTANVPEARLVRGGSEPEVVSAVATAEGWRIRLHGWTGREQTSEPRDPRWQVRGLDALRSLDGLKVAWLEGSSEVVLGRVQSTWTAYVAAWDEGDRPLADAEGWGPGVYRGAWDVVRLAALVDGFHAAWPRPDGALRVRTAGGEEVTLGPGTLLGNADGTWLWVDQATMWRHTPTEGRERVLLLPSTPERVALTQVKDVTAVAWSSGRYLGGLEVWSVHDAEAYTPTWIDRLALGMGWDPWNPWSAVAGHTLTAVLLAVLFATAALPLWWIGAAVMARFAPVDGRGVRSDGVVLGLGTLVLLLAFLKSLSGTSFALPAGVVGGTALHAGAVVLATVATLCALWGRDLESTSGRLLTAGLSGTVALAVWTFGTLNDWQLLIARGA